MRRVYRFGGGDADGGRADRALLGCEGARLGEMSRIGLNVPPGFTVTTEACRVFLRTGELPPRLWKEIEGSMARLADRTGKGFGDDRGDPLLVSVGSGAALPMPGTMGTIPGLGSTEASMGALGRTAGERLAWDSYSRFAQRYGERVAGIPRVAIERALAEAAASIGSRYGTRSDAAALVKTFRVLVREASGKEIPTDPWVQLREAMHTAFRSWDGRSAREYRRRHCIPDDLGTAVNVMAMVYGDRGDGSARGVAFTRDPTSGEARLCGHLLWSAPRGEGVPVARDPRPIAELAEGFPEVLRELEQVRRVLEAYYRDMHRFEFILERGELFILRTRTGERTGPAAVKIAADMVDEGLIDRHTASLRIAGGGRVTRVGGSPGMARGGRMSRVGPEALSWVSGRPRRPPGGAGLGPLDALPDHSGDHGEAEDQEQVLRPEGDRTEDRGQRSPADR